MSAFGFWVSYTPWFATAALDGAQRTSRVLVEALRGANSLVELWARGEPADLDLAANERGCHRRGRKGGQAPLTVVKATDVVTPSTSRLSATGFGQKLGATRSGYEIQERVAATENHSTGALLAADLAA